MNNKVEITVELKDHVKDAAASVQQSFTNMSSRLTAGFKEMAGAADSFKLKYTELDGLLKQGLSLGVLYGVAHGLKQAIDAAMQMERVNAVMKATAGSSEAAARELSFISTEANRLGLVFNATAMAYGKFSAATKNTAIEGAETRKVFTGVSEAVTALKLSTDEANGIFLALSQMMSKGKISAEELSGQLGERLPGAVKLTADAMGLTTAELLNQMKQGKLMSEDVLPKLAEQLHKTYGTAAMEAAQGGQAAFNRFNNALMETKAQLGTSLMPVLLDVMLFFKNITPYVTAFIGGLKMTVVEFAGFIDKLVAYKDYVKAFLTLEYTDSKAAKEKLKADLAAINNIVDQEKKRIYESMNISVSSSLPVGKDLGKKTKEITEEARKLAEEWAKTAKTLEKDIRLTGLDSIAKDVVTLEMQVTEMRKTFGDKPIIQKFYDIRLAEIQAKAAEEVDNKLKAVLTAASQFQQEQENSIAKHGLETQLDNIKQEEAVLKRSYDNGLISAKKFYSESIILAENAYAAKAALYQQEMTAATEALNAILYSALYTEQEKLKVAEEFAKKSMTLDFGLVNAARENGQQQVNIHAQAADEAAKLQAKAAAEAAKYWENFKNKVSDLLVQMFENPKNAIKDFFRFLKDKIIKAAADAISTPITVMVQGMFGGSAGLLSGGSSSGGNGNYVSGGITYTNTGEIANGMNQSSSGGLGGYFNTDKNSNLGGAVAAVQGFMIGMQMGQSLSKWNTGGQTGGTIGGTLGSVGGYVLGGPLGSFIGSFVGGAIGTWIGSIFGTNKKPEIGMALHQGSNAGFQPGKYWSAETVQGDKVFAEGYYKNVGEFGPMAKAAASELLQVRATAMSALTSLGMDVSGFFKDWNWWPGKAWMEGKTQEEIRAAYEGALADYVQKASNIDFSQFSTNGEKLIDTISRIIGAMATIGSVITPVWDEKTKSGWDINKIYASIDLHANTYKEGLNKIDEQISKNATAMNSGKLTAEEWGTTLTNTAKLVNDRYQAEIQYLTYIKQLQEAIAADTKNRLDAVRTAGMTPEQKFSDFMAQAAVTYTAFMNEVNSATPDPARVHQTYQELGKVFDILVQSISTLRGVATDIGVIQEQLKVSAMTDAQRSAYAMNQFTAATNEFNAAVTSMDSNRIHAAYQNMKAAFEAFFQGVQALRQVSADIDAIKEQLKTATMTGVQRAAYTWEQFKTKYNEFNAAVASLDAGRITAATQGLKDVFNVILQGIQSLQQAAQGLQQTTDAIQQEIATTGMSHQQQIAYWNKQSKDDYAAYLAATDPAAKAAALAKVNRDVQAGWAAMTPEEKKRYGAVTLDWLKEVNAQAKSDYTSLYTQAYAFWDGVGTNVKSTLDTATTRMQEFWLTQAIITAGAIATTTGQLTTFWTDMGSVAKTALETAVTNEVSALTTLQGVLRSISMDTLPAFAAALTDTTKALTAPVPVSTTQTPLTVGDTNSDYPNSSYSISTSNNSSYAMSASNTVSYAMSKVNASAQDAQPVTINLTIENTGDIGHLIQSAITTATDAGANKAIVTIQRNPGLVRAR